MAAENETPDKPLTHKQEEFCRAILQGMNQSEAYREAYNAENMLMKTICRQNNLDTGLKNIRWCFGSVD